MYVALNSRPRVAPMPTTQAPMDVVETQEAYTLTLVAPGFKPDQILIEWEQDILSVQGQAAELPADVRYHLRERRPTSFARRIRFAQSVDAERVEAHLADGLLTITLPKSEAARPRKITVRAE